MTLSRQLALLLPLAALLASGAGCSPDDAFQKHALSLSTGIGMKYVELGAPNGPAVLFLHGYTDSSRSFFPTLRHLTRLAPELRLIALDLRGHGDSSMPPAAACRHTPELCFRPVDFTADVLAFMDAKGLGRVSLVGHSMGSIIAQEMALSHPGRVERIVLVGTSATVTNNPVLRDYILAEPIEGSWKTALETRGDVYPDDFYERTPLDADPGAEAWMAANWVADPVASPDFIAQIVPETSRVRLGTWIGAARALLTVDNTARLEGLTVPAFIIWPTQDAIFPYSPDQTDLMASLDEAASRCLTGYHWKQYGKRPLPASGLQEDDIGHNVQWGAPAAVATDIAAYVKTGAPTLDGFSANTSDVHQIVTEPGAATVISKSKQGCAP